MRYSVAFLLVAPVFVLIGLFCTGVTVLNSTVWGSQLAQYNHPVCLHDGADYDSDECPVCGDSIMESGVMWRMDNVNTRYNLDKPMMLEFADYYDSFATYEEEYNLLMQYAFVFILTIVVIIAYYIVVSRIIRVRRSRNEGEEG